MTTIIDILAIIATCQIIFIGKIKILQINRFVFFFQLICHLLFKYPHKLLRINNKYENIFM